MNKIFFSVVVCMALVLAGCEMNTSDNGKLDGFWQLTHVDTIDTNHSRDMLNRHIFWAVQANMLEMRDLTDPGSYYSYIIFRFRMADGKLTLSNPIVNYREILDSVITSPQTLDYYGLHSLEETFDVEQLDDKKMVLRSEHRIRFHLKRY